MKNVLLPKWGATVQLVIGCFCICFSTELCQLALLVPVLLWVLRQHNDRLLADDIFQSLLHLDAPSSLWSPG